MKRSLTLILLFVGLGIGLRSLTSVQDDPDSLYHLRRARFVLQNFPKTIIFDPLINFPQGGICIWPPLFDVTLAAPALMLYGTGATAAQQEHTAALVPLVYAAGAILAAGLAGLALRRRAGVLAALFVAICPAHLEYSQYAHTDQHVAESCWGFFALATFLWACRKNKMWLEAASGTFLTLAVLTWQGSIFWAGIFSAAIAAEPFGKNRATAFRKAILILGLPAVVVALATWYWLSGFQVPFTYISFGWFQPVFLSFLFGSTMLFLLLVENKRLNMRFAVLRVVLLLAALCPVIYFWHDFSTAVFSGVEHLATSTRGFAMVKGGLISYPQEWLVQIAEYQPLLAQGWTLPFGILSGAFFLSPIAILFWGFRARFKTRPGFYVFLVAWGTFLFVTTLIQRRNAYYASLLAAFCALDISALLSVRLRRKMDPLERRKADGVLLTAIFVAFVLPMLFRLPADLKTPERPELLDALAVLKHLAPPELNPYDHRFLDPGARVQELKTAHSVIASWSQGHSIMYDAELPVVADNFGYGYFDFIHFFFAKSEEKALAIAKAHRVRYVLVKDFLPIMNDYGRAIGEQPYFVLTRNGLAPLPRYFDSLQCRLYDFDGTGATLGTIRVEPLHHFILRYSSPSGITRFGRFVAAWKIFEIH